ncbi:MAG: lactate utilization protein [Peptococcaceae bacterium]
MLIKELFSELLRNGFQTRVVENKYEAQKMILNMITDKSKVGIGGSITIQQLDLVDRLKEMDCDIYWHFNKKLPREEDLKIYKMQQVCDFFLASCNAITKDGKLIFIDGSGNRISATIFGPDNVILVVGKNKIVDSIEEGINRARNYCAPRLYKLKNSPAPCAINGEHCLNCRGELKQCRVIAIIENIPKARRDLGNNFTIILVNEDLGI